MAEKRKIVWDFAANTRDLDRGLQGTERRLSGTERATVGAQRGLGNVAKVAGGLGVTLGAMELGQWALDAAAMSEQAEIAGDALEDVLGPAAESLRDRLDDTRRIMGLSRGEVDLITAKLSLMATGMGASDEAAADLVATMVERGGDLAAFTGQIGEATGAIDAIGSALKGEFDALEAFGVKLSEAKVAAEIARREGLDPAFESLSEGEQRLEAIIGLIEEGAAPALGALGDAAETTAGQQNQLNSQWKDFQELIGGPINAQLGDTTGLLLDMTTAVEGMATQSGTAEDRLKDLNTAIGNIFRELISGIPGAVKLWDTYTGAVRRAWRSVGDFIERAKDIPGAVGGVVTAPIRGLAGLIPGFQSGGTVPGPVGAPQLAVVHGGEQITPPGGGGGGGASVVINVGVIGDPDAVGNVVVDALDRWERLNGPRPSGLGYEG